MTNKLKAEIINILDNITYWDVCPKEYKSRIAKIKIELGVKACENVIHHSCKNFCEYNGCMNCIVNKYEKK